MIGSLQLGQTGGHRCHRAQEERAQEEHAEPRREEWSMGRSWSPNSMATWSNAWPKTTPTPRYVQRLRLWCHGIQGSLSLHTVPSQSNKQRIQQSLSNLKVLCGAIIVSQKLQRRSSALWYVNPLSRVCKGRNMHFGSLVLTVSTPASCPGRGLITMSANGGPFCLKEP